MMMRITLLISALTLCSLATATDVPSDTRDEAMEKHQVVPDVVDKIPTHIIQVNFGDLEVNLGNELTPTQVKAPPTTLIWPTQPDALYTLCMTDPDAPSRQDPQFREVLHWLVGNIPGNAVTQGLELAGYRGSGPPQGTGLHRYVFLVYRQPGNLTFDEKLLIPSNTREGRRSFSIRALALKYDMKLEAANFFQAQYDSYVDELNKMTVG